MPQLNNSNLDFLRATAVIYVFASHLAYFRGIYRLGPLKIVPLGFWGVLIFFVHTCLVLMLSLERQSNQSGVRRLFSSFMVRRCFRIFPLSILIVAFIAIFHFPQQVVEPGRFVGAAATPWDIASNFLLIQNLTTNVSILGPLWSLPYEIQMYLFLPFIFLIIRPSKSIYPLLLLWLLSIILSLFALSRTQIPDLLLYIPCFLPGVVAYQLMRTERFRLPAFLWPMAILAMTIVFLIEIGWPYRWASCLILGFAVPRFAPLSNRWLVALSSLIARYSYGIYLTHFFAIWLALVRFHAFPKPLRIAVFMVCLVGLPVFFYHCLEEPMIRLGKRLADRIVDSQSLTLTSTSTS